MNGINGRTCTRTGRVVYDRKKHTFDMRAVVRIIDTLEGQTELLRKQAIPVRYVWELMNKSLYPDVADLFVSDVTLRRWLKTRGLYNMVRKIWKEMTKSITDEVLKEVGVPDVIRKPLMNYLFGLLYSIIEGIFAPKEAVEYGEE